MAFDFQKLGIDRLSQNVARSVNQPVGALVTGDITKGSVVEVVIDNASSGSTKVSARRTGALLLGMSYSGNAEYKWDIVESTLTVDLNGSVTGTFKFWVF